MYSAKVLADSISPEGHTITTLEVEYPHAIHKDIMTHRMFSRNFQSFRAYPPEKVIEKIREDPFVPESFDLRVKGMGQGDPSPGQERAAIIWNNHIKTCIDRAETMIEMKLAKAQVNFVLQDLTWIKGIITATDWDNFFALRLDVDEEGRPKARPEVYKIASMMRDAIDTSSARKLEYGKWHLPLVDDGELELFTLKAQKAVSTGRTGRVSYLTHDGVRNPVKDVELHDNLLGDGHMSPFDHPARPFTKTEWGNIRSLQHRIDWQTWNPQQAEILKRQLEYCGNYRGWVPYRKEIPNENNYGLMTNG